MKQFWFVAASLLALGVGTLPAQKPAVAPAGPTFDVVSIKPVDMPTPAQIASGKIHAGMKIDAARVDIGLVSLMELICKAYDVKPYQVQGPEWMKGPLNVQRFDVMAKMPPGATKDQVPQMLQAMLAERFGLVIHKDKKEQSVLALIVDKGGPKIKESAPLAPPPPPEAGGPTAASSGSSEVTVKQSGTGGVVTDGEGLQQKVSVADGKIHYDITGMTMAKFVESGVTPFVDKPVVDLTELKGRYDIVMDIPMAEVMAVARKMGANIPASAPGADTGHPADAAEEPTGSIITILKSLGLKLESRKVPVDLIVVEKVEKTPTEN